MTKLMEWLLAGFLIFGSWMALIIGKVNSSSDIEWYYKWFPIILASVFGLYSIIVVLYRVFTFNNCESAAIELQNQIKEATADLEARGIKLKRSTT